MNSHTSFIYQAATFNFLHGVGHTEIVRHDKPLFFFLRKIHSVSYAVVSLSKMMILSIFVVQQPFCPSVLLKLYHGHESLTWPNIKYPDTVNTLTALSFYRCIMNPVFQFHCPLCFFLLQPV